ncbi:MAG: BTAD domain-containing putative transcriptional regulator [Actinomycetota bacterium]
MASPTVAEGDRAGVRSSRTDRTLEIGVLGPLEVVVDGRSVDPGSRKQRVLLLRLLAARGRVVPHGQLVEALWGDDPPGAPEVSLRSYVSNLRKLIEPGRSRAEPSAFSALGDAYTLTLDEGVLDVDRFTEDLRSARAARDPELRLVRAERALRRWRGTPLADAAGAPFALTLVSSWSAMRSEAMEQRADALLALGRIGEAIAAGEEMVTEDPLAERAWAHLAVACYRAGRQADALAAIDTAREVLREQLGVDPGAELGELEHRILVHDDSLHGEPVTGASSSGARPAVTRSEPEPLVGRDGELDDVAGAMRAGPNGPSVVVLTGPAGIGKTHLLDASLDQVGDRVLPVRIGCDPAGRSTGLLALATSLREVLELIGEAEADELVGADRAVLADLVLPGRPAREAPEIWADDPDRFLVFDSLSRLIGRLSQRRPVAVVVEDAHWAGVRLWELLAFLLTRRSPGRLAIVVTARAAEVDRVARPHLARLQSAPGARSIELTPLDIAAIHELVIRQLGPAAAPIAEDIHRRSAGNPLFARELLRSIDPADPVASLQRLDPPATLRQVIVGRVAELPHGADELLTVGALLGSPFDLQLAADVASVPVADATEIVEAGCRRGLLIEVDERPGQLAFRHEIVRETIVSAVTRLRRARWHARIGERLEHDSDPDDPMLLASIARHLARGAAAGTALAAGRAALVAIDASFARHEVEQARQQAEAGLAALDDASRGVERTRLRSQLWAASSTAARRLGELASAHAAARAAHEAAAELTDRPVMARAAVTLSGGPPTAPWWGFWSAVHDAPGLVESVLADGEEEDGEPDDLALLWCARSAHLCASGDLSEADRAAERAVGLAAASGAPELETAALLGSWRVADLAGTPTDRRVRGERIIARAQAAGFGPGVAVGLRCSAGAHLERGDLVGARAELARMEELARRSRSEPIGYDAGTLAVALDLFEGRLDRAERRLIATLDRFGHFGRGWLGVLDLQFVRLFYEQHRMHLLEGQLRTRIAEHDSAAWRAGLLTMLTQHGRHDEAHELLAAIPRSELVRFVEPAVQFVPMALFADSIADLGDRRRAAWLLDVLGPRADRLVSMSNGILYSGWLSLPVGRLLGVLGRFEDARRQLGEARARAVAAGSPLFELRARVALVELDARRGEPDDERAERLGTEAAASGFEAVAAWAQRLASAPPPRERVA